MRKKPLLVSYQLPRIIGVPDRVIHCYDGLHYPYVKHVRISACKNPKLYKNPKLKDTWVLFYRDFHSEALIIPYSEYFNSEHKALISMEKFLNFMEDFYGNNKL